MTGLTKRYGNSVAVNAIDLNAASGSCCWLLGPSVVGIGMFGFTLSWDKIARSSQAIGDMNTMPLELKGLTTTVTTPAFYALGSVTIAVLLLVIGITLLAVALLRSRKAGGA